MLNVFRKMRNLSAPPVSILIRPNSDIAIAFLISDTLRLIILAYLVFAKRSLTFSVVQFVLCKIRDNSCSLYSVQPIFI